MSPQARPSGQHPPSRDGGQAKYPGLAQIDSCECTAAGRARLVTRRRSRRRDGDGIVRRWLANTARKVAESVHLQLGMYYDMRERG